MTRDSITMSCPHMQIYKEENQILKLSNKKQRLQKSSERKLKVSTSTNFLRTSFAEIKAKS